MKSQCPHCLHGVILFFVSVLVFGCTEIPLKPILDHHAIVTKQYGNDDNWYLENIPFFECSDKEIEDVYYYRWKLYKAHLRNVGDNRFIVTEFINHVPWDHEPYCTINAASMHHIYEGRWLKDQRFMNGYIDYLNRQGGNDRKYSESIADATYSRYLVNADKNFVESQLDSLKRSYQGWSDHWDSSKNLYYIPAMPDATEYTIASIDASGGKDGFDDGEAFRPTINSYMYGNAMAISKIAFLKGDAATGDDYAKNAASLKRLVEENLWNDSLHHFTDRFKVNNQYVHYWNFIRGRELAGYAPWYFNLPANNPKYGEAWKHLLDTTQLLGKYGFRTNEPSYEYYFKQFVFFEGKPGSQWNGPSWPYQSSQALTAMANFLNNYDSGAVSKSDYLKVLRLFANQHYLPDGRINLVENYQPNKGGPIVYYYWSNHYNHSSFNNLVITGLAGIRPSEGDTLSINPLIDESIKYFCLEELSYHGHLLTVLYDRDGSRYGKGKGLFVFVDGKKAELVNRDGKSFVKVGSAIASPVKTAPKDIALNLEKKGFPTPSASINTFPDSLFQAIDGRVWYFPEISNRWTTRGSSSGKDWYGLDFGKEVRLSGLNISLYGDDKEFAAPDSIQVEYLSAGQWKVAGMKTQPKLLTNTGNKIEIDPVETTGIRVQFSHQAKQVALVELECY